MNDQWTFQRQIQKRPPPFEAKRRADETTPNPDRPGGRISDETARLHMNQYVSRTLECQTRLSVSDLRFRVTVRDGIRQRFVRVRISLRNYYKYRRSPASANER